MSRSDRITLAIAGGALVMATAAAWLLLTPADGIATGEVATISGELTVPSQPATPAATAPTDMRIVVDVQGAVAEPGVRELPAGSRIADAIAAAGGYAFDADLVASAVAINLAQALGDGEQVRVPRVGDAQAAAGEGTSSGPPAPGSGGLVDLNTATPEELEALPGIGPVTVQKIVAARQEQPFASLEEAVERGVMNRGQLEDIQSLATAG